MLGALPLDMVLMAGPGGRRPHVSWLVGAFRPRDRRGYAAGVRHNHLDHLIGTRQEDPDFDRAVAEFERVGRRVPEMHATLDRAGSPASSNASRQARRP